MIRYILPLLLSLLSCSSYALEAGPGFTCVSRETEIRDSLENQLLYNGSIWRNAYAAIEGNQFMFTSAFIEGTIEIDNHTFSNIKLRYDIQEDELQTLKNDGNIIQLNKDKVSSFSVNYNGALLNFRNMDMDTIGALRGFCNLLYDSGLKLYVKYQKDILPTSYTNGLPRFNQVNSIYVMKDNKIIRTNKRKDMLNLFTKEYRVNINKFIRNHEIVVTRTDPESFRQVIEYAETLIK
jgi:hypothetical protein